MIVREEKIYKLIITSDIITTRSSLKSLFKQWVCEKGISRSLKDMFYAYLFLLT